MKKYQIKSGVLGVQVEQDGSTSLKHVYKMLFTEDEVFTGEYIHGEQKRKYNNLKNLGYHVFVVDPILKLMIAVEPEQVTVIEE